jgi:hypothetical protein
LRLWLRNLDFSTDVPEKSASGMEGVVIIGTGHAGARPRRAVEGGLLVFHLAGDGRLVCTSGVASAGTIGRDVRVAQLMIERRMRPRPDAPADPTVRLKSLLVARRRSGVALTVRARVDGKRSSNRMVSARRAPRVKIRKCATGEVRPTYRRPTI